MSREGKKNWAYGDGDKGIEGPQVGCRRARAFHVPYGQHDRLPLCRRRDHRP